MRRAQLWSSYTFRAADMDFGQYRMDHEDLAERWDNRRPAADTFFERLLSRSS